MKNPFAAFGAALALLALSAAAAPPLLAGEATQTTRFDVEIMGSGPDVVLIPGLNSTREVWRPTAEALASDHRVHLVQLSGFGSAAGANAQGPILDPLVDELASYLKEQGIESPTIVGHSLGGFTALRLALRHPQTVGRIVVVDSLPFFSVLFDPAATAESAAPQAAQFKAMTLAIGRQAGPADCDHVGPAFARMSNTREGRCKVAHWAAEADPAVSAQLVFELMTSDMRQAIGGLSVPTAVLYARDPAMGPADLVDTLWHANYAAAADAVLVPIDGSLHFTMLDNFDATLAAIRRALQAD